MSKISKISIEPIGTKRWVRVYFENGTTWVPAIPEIAAIAHRIGICEDEKYDFPRNNVKGAEMVFEYIRDAVLFGSDPATLKMLNRKYKLPEQARQEVET